MGHQRVTGVEPLSTLESGYFVLLYRCPLPLLVLCYCASKHSKRSVIENFNDTNHWSICLLQHSREQKGSRYVAMEKG